MDEVLKQGKICRGLTICYTGDILDKSRPDIP